MAVVVFAEWCGIGVSVFPGMALLRGVLVRLRRAFISQGMDQAGLFHGGGLGAAVGFEGNFDHVGDIVFRDFVGTKAIDDPGNIGGAGPEPWAVFRGLYKKGDCVPFIAVVVAHTNRCFLIPWSLNSFQSLLVVVSPSPDEVLGNFIQDAPCLSAKGKNVPIATGNESDALLALLPDTRKFVVLRVPYPIGFCAKGLDGRIDDPKVGWKGKGLWATFGTRAPFHVEGGKGTTSKVLHFQLRPIPAPTTVYDDPTPQL